MSRLVGLFVALAAVPALAQTPAKTPPPAPMPTPTGQATTPKTPVEPDPWKGRADLYMPPNLQPTTKVNVGAVSRSTRRSPR